MSSTTRRDTRTTVIVVILLLLLWALLTFLGFVLKGMLWLTVMAGGFFIATLLAGAGMWWGRSKRR